MCNNHDFLEIVPWNSSLVYDVQRRPAKSSPESRRLDTPKSIHPMIRHGKQKNDTNILSLSTTMYMYMHVYSVSYYEM